MTVKEAIEQRRAYRSFDPVIINNELISNLGEIASLAPSCMNKQPWRFLFCNSPEVLQKIHPALSPGNDWAKSASMIVAVFSAKELDCRVKGRDYYLFDCGMATAFIILRATELELVAHPIAGFDEEQVKAALNIPEEMTVITLVNIGKHSAIINPALSENMILGEKNRPERYPLEKTVFLNNYQTPFRE
jgi:nitroreductase